MYILESADPEESEALATFVERVIIESVDAAPSEKAAFIANTRKNLAKWAAEPDASFHVVGRANGTLAGVVLVRDYWNLCHLFVAAEHQGRGLGRQLLEAALLGCAGRSPRGCIRLNSSRNALEFYKHMGFSPVLDAPAPYQGIQFERQL